MKIDILCAGRTPAPAEKVWLDDYLARAGGFARVSLTRVREKVRPTPEETSRATWPELKKKIARGSRVIVLDESGQALSTREFQDLFARIERSGTPAATFVLGGSSGLPPEAKEIADTLLALSPMTLPHRIALLVLVEQIYRVLSMKAGGPYHRG